VAVWLWLVPLAAAESLPPEIRQPLNDYGIPGSAVSLLVEPVLEASPVLELNGTLPRNPGSVIKLVTTAAALELLGPGYTWNTQALISGTLRDGRLDGDLVLKGHGDPYLTPERFWQFLRGLHDRGVSDIRGDLVIDGSWSQTVSGRRADFDGKPHRAYNALPHPLTVNFQATTLYLRKDPGSQALRAFTYPPLSNLQLEQAVDLVEGGCRSDLRRPRVDLEDSGQRASIRLTGSYASACPEFSSPLLLLEPIAHVEGIFRVLWRELGGSFLGGVRAGTARAGAVLVHEQRSVALAEVVRGINKFSNNLMSRLLLLTLGAESEGAPGDLNKGRTAVRRWLQDKGLWSPGLVVDNGSGLSRSARVSARDLARLLQSVYGSPYMPELMASLPVAGVDGTLARRLLHTPLVGRAHVKTGSLDGVSAMAGYVLDRDARRWVVVLLINHRAPGWQGRRVQDALMQWVYSGAGRG
jgi:D-alanyl-D-alanine carboxypeptidase/D-alanyl-D-alanine-endopeptidase (penicillin-binding protein 4)